MIRLRDILSEKKADSENAEFDRVAYYEDYIKRLVPDNFKVEKKDNEIIIKIKN